MNRIAIKFFQIDFNIDIAGKEIKKNKNEIS